MHSGLGMLRSDGSLKPHAAAQSLTLQVPDHPIIVELTRANPISVGERGSRTKLPGAAALRVKFSGQAGNQASMLRLDYHVPKAGWVEITLHGAQVAVEATLIKRFHRPGMHAWNAPLRGNGRNTGIHWLRMRSDGAHIGGAKILIP